RRNAIITYELGMSLIRSRRIDLESRPIELSAIVEDVSTLLASRIERNDVDLAIRIDPSLPDHYVGDAARIRQLLVNLVGNAVKFTHQGYVAVDVSGKAENGRAALTISVTDTGIGVPKEHQKSIFERFEQAEIGSKRRYGGAGLGLAI